MLQFRAIAGLFAISDQVWLIIVRAADGAGVGRFAKKNANRMAGVRGSDVSGVLAWAVSAQGCGPSRHKPRHLAALVAEQPDIIAINRNRHGATFTHGFIKTGQERPVLFRQ